MPPSKRELELRQRIAGPRHQAVELNPLPAAPRPLPGRGGAGPCARTAAALDCNRPGGSICALAIEAPKRLPSLPDVPNFGEAGLPQMDNMAWYGLVAPAGTPQAVVDRIHAAAVKVLKDPKIAQRLADGGSLVDGSTPAEYAALIKRELELRQRIARTATSSCRTEPPAGRAASSAPARRRRTVRPDRSPLTAIAPVVASAPCDPTFPPS